MATYGGTVRRGLPRVAGGDAWPPAGDAPVEVAATVADAAPVADGPVADAAPVADAPVATAPAAATAAAQVTPSVASAAPKPQEASGESASSPRALRRGLPRVVGGEPWPPAGSAPAVTSASAAAS